MISRRTGSARSRVSRAPGFFCGVEPQRGRPLGHPPFRRDILGARREAPLVDPQKDPDRAQRVFDEEVLAAKRLLERGELLLLDDPLPARWAPFLLPAQLVLFLARVVEEDEKLAAVVHERGERRPLRGLRQDTGERRHRGRLDLGCRVVDGDRRARRTDDDGARCLGPLGCFDEPLFRRELAEPRQEERARLRFRSRARLNVDVGEKSSHGSAYRIRAQAQSTPAMKSAA